MFGWRKKNQGFEWHQYVRTTIKHRRDGRRARVDAAKQGVINGVKGAGAASVAAGGRGAAAVWAAVVALPAMAVGKLGPGIGRPVGRWIGGISDIIGGIYDSLPPLGAQLAKPGVRPLLCLFGAVAAGSGLVRLQTSGFDRDAKLALGCAALLGLAAAYPAVARLASGRGGATMSQKRLAQSAAAAALVVGLIWGGSQISQNGGRSLNASGLSLAKLNPFSGAAIEGAATAVTGDVLRLQGQLVRLDGIEAPERDQRCGTGAAGRGSAKRWSCGEVAADTLARIVRGKTVRCSVSGQDELGRGRGSCQIDGQNIAAELVRAGLAFSAGGLLSGFGALEQDARNQKLGLWKGEADRPAEHRAKIWAAAQKAAPNNCPIKGQMVGDAKRYVLPWQVDYARVRVRAQKGERWFCSEQEAQAAGWKVAERG
jgi:endonuclease YncB( thermonuclease family)